MTTLSMKFMMRFDPVNEGGTKDTDRYNMSLHCEDIVLEYLYHMRIDIKRMMSREALTFEEDVHMLEDVILKDNENLERALMWVVDMSINMVEYVVHHM